MIFVTLVFVWTKELELLSGVAVVLYVSCAWNNVRTWREGGEIEAVVFPIRWWHSESGN